MNVAAKQTLLPVMLAVLALSAGCGKTVNQQTLPNGEAWPTFKGKPISLRRLATGSTSIQRPMYFAGHPLREKKPKSSAKPAFGAFLKVRNWKSSTYIQIRMRIASWLLGLAVPSMSISLCPATVMPMQSVR